MSSSTSLACRSVGSPTNNSSVAGSKTGESGWPPIVDLLLYRVLFPTELTVGFACQLLNLWVLHGRKIRSLTYTTYLKSLSATYLLTIPFLSFWVWRKAGMVERRSRLLLLYYAHVEQFATNLFLFTANLLVVVLALDSVRGMTCPMGSMRASRVAVAAVVVDSERGAALVMLLLCYTLVALVLSPLLLTRSVVADVDEPALFCIKRLSVGWAPALQQLTAATFELVLMGVVTALYACLFVQYQRVVSRHRRGVRQLRETESRRLLANKAKAVAICLGSVSAYLISNSPSAAKELLRLTPAKPLARMLVPVANFALMSNFTLTVLLQYFVSRQYREKVHKTAEELRRGCVRVVALHSRSSAFETADTIEMRVQTRHRHAANEHASSRQRHPRRHEPILIR